MRPDLGTFFQHADADLTAGSRSQLLQTDRRRKPGRPAAYDNDIVFHAFALDRLGHGGFPKISCPDGYGTGDLWDAIPLWPR